MEGHRDVSSGGSLGLGGLVGGEEVTRVLGSEALSGREQVYDPNPRGKSQKMILFQNI